MPYFGKGTTVNLTKITSNSSFNDINNNFQKIQAELIKLRGNYEPRIINGEQANDRLNRYLGQNPPISRQDSQEFTRSFTTEYAQKQITFNSTAPENPDIGDIWGQTDPNDLTKPPVFYKWDGISWVKISLTDFTELEGMIDSSQLPDRVITSIKLAIDAVQSENIAAQAVDTAKIKLGAVTDQLIADGAIRETKLADLAVTLNKLADGAVGTTKLMDEAITNAKIAADAVAAINIQNGAIGNTKLADLAVDAAKLADSAVTATKIANLVVGTAAIQDLAVTNAKIADIHADKITAGIIAAERVAIGPLSQFASGYDPSTKETPQGAQNKANQAEQNAINYTDLTTPAVKNGFEDNEFSKWQLRGELTRVTDRFTGTYAGQFISIKTNPASGGSLTDTPALEIKNTLAAQFSGKRIKISFWAKTPSSNGTNEFAIQYSTGHVGNSGWQRFTPTSSWKEYVFYYTLSPITQNISHWLGVWADTSGTGKAILIDNVTITLASMEEDLILWKYPNTTYIDGGNIYTNTITANQIASRTITAAKIASGTITSNEIASRTIQAENIVSGTITANEISANAITANEIAAGTITANELAADSVTAVQLAAGSVYAGAIQADAVGASAIAANAILAEHIAAGAISTNHLAADAVTANAIAAGAVLAEHINVTSLDAISANLGTITAGTINGITINSSSFNTNYNDAMISRKITLNQHVVSVDYYDKGLGYEKHIYLQDSAIHLKADEGMAGPAVFNEIIIDADYYGARIELNNLVISEKDSKLAINDYETIERPSNGDAYFKRDINNYIRILANAHHFYTGGYQLARLEWTNGQVGTHGQLVMGSALIKGVNDNTNPRMQIRRYDDTDWANLQIKTLTEFSSQEGKENIREYEGNALEKIISTRVVNFNYLNDEEERLGIIYEEAPVEVQDSTAKGVRTLAMTALAWKAIQELSKQVESLEQRIGGNTE